MIQGDIQTLKKHVEYFCTIFLMNPESEAPCCRYLHVDVQTSLGLYGEGKRFLDSL